MLLLWNKCAVKIGAPLGYSSRAIIFQIKVRRVPLSENPGIMHLLSPLAQIDLLLSEFKKGEIKLRLGARTITLALFCLNLPETIKCILKTNSNNALTLVKQLLLSSFFK